MKHKNVVSWLNGAALGSIVLYGAWSLIPVVIACAAVFVAALAYGVQAFALPTWAFALGAAMLVLGLAIVALLQPAPRQRLWHSVRFYAKLSFVLLFAAGLMYLLLESLGPMDSGGSPLVSRLEAGSRDAALSITTSMAWFAVVGVPAMIASAAVRHLWVEAHSQ